MDHNLTRLYEGMYKNPYKKPQNLKDLYTSKVLKEDVMIAGIPDSGADEILGTVSDDEYMKIKKPISSMLETEFNNSVNQYLSEKGINDSMIKREMITLFGDHKHIFNKILQHYKSNELPQFSDFINEFKEKNDLVNFIVSFYKSKNIIESDYTNLLVDVFYTIYNMKSRSIGKAEIALSVFTQGKKAVEVGDVVFDDITVESKGDYGVLQEAINGKILTAYVLGKNPAEQIRARMGIDILQEIQRRMFDNNDIINTFFENSIYNKEPEIKTFLNKQNVSPNRIKYALAYLDLKEYMNNGHEFIFLSKEAAKRKIYAILLNKNDPNLFDNFQKHVNVMPPNFGSSWDQAKGFALAIKLKT